MSRLETIRGYFADRFFAALANNREWQRSNTRPRSSAARGS